jgi:hypothetical protein
MNTPSSLYAISSASFMLTSQQEVISWGERVVVV